MKKIKLRQPYASMVISGALEVIPNIWDDVEYNEKIFIYADKVGKDCNNGLDPFNKLHRKAFNEMFLGNIPDSMLSSIFGADFSDEDFKTGAFLGYVSVYHSGEVIKYWSNKSEEELFVSHPHEFKQKIEDFDSDFATLESAHSCPIKTKRMARKDNRLYVPVGKYVWNMLHSDDGYENVVMFHEQYMNKIVPRMYMEEIDWERIKMVTFRYKNSIISFPTNYETGVICPSEICDKTNEGNIHILNFDLYDPANNSRKSMKNREEQSQIEAKKNKRKYLRIIYTPMGGNTGWRR